MPYLNSVTPATIEKIVKALEVQPTDLFTFPLHKSDEVNELYALIGDMVSKDDAEAIKNMIVFVKEILILFC